MVAVSLAISLLSMSMIFYCLPDLLIYCKFSYFSFVY